MKSKKQSNKPGLISILFIRRDSIYKQFKDCDCFDFDRNALNYSGGSPIVAHPPCRAWGKLKHFAKPRVGEKELAIWAISQIRKNGGVLEHPFGSTLWKEINLPLGDKIDEYGGFTISVNQHWFGHRAEKKTLLYICGCKKNEIPEISLNFNAITHVIQTSSKYSNKKNCSAKEREATPLNFAKWLVELAKRCDKSKITGNNPTK